jgi:hypothetical protein
LAWIFLDARPRELFLSRFLSSPYRETPKNAQKRTTYARFFLSAYLGVSRQGEIENEMRGGGEGSAFPKNPPGIYFPGGCFYSRVDFFFFFFFFFRLFWLFVAFLSFPYRETPKNAQKRVLFGLLAYMHVGLRFVGFFFLPLVRSRKRETQRRDYPITGAASEGRTRTGGGQNARWKQIRP